MATQILNDIHNDLKLLITSLTGFEESEQGFQVCEKFVISNIKHHRFLSIDSHATKRLLAGVIKKLKIHGKYNVARELENLVQSFLESFDFDKHPQYDLQWSLLSLLLHLTTDTTKSDIKCLQESKLDESLSLVEGHDEIDWAQHLNEGREEFFCQYGSSSESEWSEDEDENPPDEIDTLELEKKYESTPSISSSQLLMEKVNTFNQVIVSRNWLDANVENTWWNEINHHECEIVSEFSHARLCDIYQKGMSNNLEKNSKITEYQALREILWMFHIPMEMVVYQEKNDNKFSVRENLSIPSLTSSAFISAFSTFTRYFSMIKRLLIFEKNLHIKYNSNKLSPLTLETYTAVVKQHMNYMKKNIINIEKKIMRQNDISTFLTLTKDLQLDLKRIELLDGIHQSITSCLIEEVNFKKSYRLLAGIYRQMEASSSRERTNLCASLYLSSLSVYLNIVDTWLSEGRLEDFRCEFLINKQIDKSKNEDDPTRTTIVIVECNDEKIYDPVLKGLFRKVKDMGRSIEILVTLDRMSDMWKSHSQQYESRIQLSDEFISEVLSELGKYGADLCDETDTIEEINRAKAKKKKKINSTTSELEDNIKQQIHRINNPFLMKVFQAYLPPIPSQDIVDAKFNDKKELIWGGEIFHRLEKISPYILPFRKVLEDVLGRILDQRYSRAARIVKDILVNEYKLEQHLKLMRSIYMMEREHIMKKFYQQMFHAIENNLSVTNPYSLTNILEEVLSDEWKDSRSDNHWSISINDVRTRQVLQAVDGVVLHYSIGWPISMVLSDDILEKYNDIFRFQLKLKWAVWTLSNLRFSDLEKSDGDDMNDILQHFYARRLECLRFWLLHAIGSIHSYLSGQVLQSLGIILENKLSQADSLDTIIQAHNDYLEKVHEHCLQTPQFADILVTINNMLGMCAHIRDRWKHGAKQLIASDLDLMECSYTKYHTYLALALHNAVQHKEADFYKMSPKLQVMKDRLTEIAHQSLPPSGIPFSIPPLVQKHNQFWTEMNIDDRSNQELFLSEYDDTFLHLWYQSIENSLSINRSRYDVSEELSDLLDEDRY